MKKKFEDIVPSDKRSIRNIPLPTREEKDRQKHPSMDGIRPARTFNSGIQAPAQVSAEALVQEPALQSKPVTAKKVIVKKSLKRKPEIVPPESAAYERAHEQEPAVSVVDNGQESYGEEAFNSKKPRWRAWTLIVVALLGVGYFVSAYFAHADITISLAKNDILVSNVKIPLNEVDYTVVSGELSKSATVQASGSQKISRKATGTVVIYNVSNTKPQRLLINTRLETLDGHLYKTDKEVTVPAIKVVNGKKLAGSVEVTITADQPGAGYNLGLKDFNLPGFKGTENYTVFYARSKTPLTGGFVGTAPNINQADLAEAISSLKKEISEESDEILAKKVTEEVTKEHDFIYVKGAQITEYDAADIKQSEDGKSASVTVGAKITGLGLSNASLSGLFVSSDAMPKNIPQTATSSQEKYSGDFSKLTIEVPANISSRALLASVNDLNSNITLTANGSASIVSEVDGQALAKAVSHLSRQQAVDVIKSMIDLDMIEVSLKPWWMRSLPSADKVRVNIEK